MFLLRHNNRNSDVMAVRYVCYDITRNNIFDVKWKWKPQSGVQRITSHPLSGHAVQLCSTTKPE